MKKFKKVKKIQKLKKNMIKNFTFKIFNPKN